jgi:hypothetical protein
MVSYKIGNIHKILLVRSNTGGDGRSLWNEWKRKKGIRVFHLPTTVVDEINVTMKH